jgi:hypothetical protein
VKPVADITGGNVLRIPAIRSPNYVANVSGWTINQDGTAQFNSATFIGSITITNGNDLLIYNTAAPAAGSIVMALSPNAGSDTAGNTWGPGFTLFDGTSGATMVNFGANTGFEFANPDNTIGIALLLSNVPVHVQASAADNNDRFELDINGGMSWGPGNAALDTVLQRTAAGILALTQGSFSVTTAGQGLRVKEGANAKQGTAVLAGGTVVVANTSVTANSRILLTAQTSGAAPGALRVSARTAGTSFTITSTSATDTSTVAYQIFEPG